MVKSVNNHLSVTSGEYLSAICKPLRDFRINGFGHDITFSSGEISILSTEKNIFEIWHKNQIPAICTDDNGRTLGNGIFLDNYLANNFPDYMRSEGLVRELYNASRMLLISEKHDDCQHLFTFTFSECQDDNSFNHLIINSLFQLRNFIERYKILAKDLIHEIKKPANRIKLPVVSSAYNQGQSLNELYVRNLSIIHKNSKIAIHLSKQQSICLVLLMQNLTAKEIAIKMNLSYRTVQHYFERIRNILGCYSNNELILSYANQVHLQSMPY